MAEDAIREEIKQRLQSGLQTEVQPRADTHEAVQEIIARLRAADGSLERRLVIGGFTLDPITHGGYRAGVRDLHVLSHPPAVLRAAGARRAGRAEWSCRLWRI